MVRELTLPERLRRKSKGWKKLRQGFLSETPQLLVDAADEIERLQGIINVAKKIIAVAKLTK